MINYLYLRVFSYLYNYNENKYELEAAVNCICYPSLQNKMEDSFYTLFTYKFFCHFEMY